MPVTYIIPGSLPAQWEDFICEDKSHPNITLMTTANATEDGGPDGEPSGDGWLDRVLDVPVIDEDCARLAIAEALGIANPEDIKIVQKGICQSV